MHARRYLAKLEHERRAPDDTASDAKYVYNFLPNSNIYSYNLLSRVKNASSLWTPQEIQIFEARLAQVKILRDHFVAFSHN